MVVLPPPHGQFFEDSRPSSGGEVEGRVSNKNGHTKKQIRLSNRSR